MDYHHESPDVILSHYLDQLQQVIDHIRLYLLLSFDTPQIAEHPDDNILHHLKLPTNPFNEILRTAQLTTREHEVLSLICRGFSDKQIADRLFISTSTVKTHVRHVLQKTGLPNRHIIIAQFNANIGLANQVDQISFQKHEVNP